jgi:hypothetical protein
LATSLAKALRERPVGVEDAATVALARRLAAEIDDAESAAVVEKLTPRLLAVLTALQMTPASRVAARPPAGGTEEPARGGVASVGRDVVAEQRGRYADPR